jgi:L-asparaginase/Glu-tRNA(Gln) amidotransferase subunit D
VKVGVVLTGGTIGAELRGSTLAVGSQPTDAELGLLGEGWPASDEPPEVVVDTPLRKLSENIVPRDWLTIAASVRRLLDGGDLAGVLVLHGTDTMAHTAAALSFLLSDLGSPIVLTGASAPASQPGSDAAVNVRAALVALGALESGTFVAFAGSGERPPRIYLGTRVRKAGSHEQTFASVNRQLVALVEGGELSFVEPYAHRLRPRSAQDVDEQVLALRLYPGLDFEGAYAAVVGAGARGVVIELYPSATGPDTGDRFSLPAFVRKCAHDGVIVATVAPAGASGGVGSGGLYETSLAIAEAGGVFLGDMLPEVATVKLMWALAQSEGMAAVAELMLTPVAGELAAPLVPGR